MTHKPIRIEHLSFSLPHQCCFDDFNTTLYYGDRIALMGKNGSGKSSLLRLLEGSLEPSSGGVIFPTDMVLSHVPQIIESFNTLSGGQRFQKALTMALSKKPNILLLDEPTNHLDREHREKLLRLLKSYHGTLLIASHDVFLLKEISHILWHIDHGKIHTFHGNYSDYKIHQSTQRDQLEKTLKTLSKEKKEIHHALMKEQKRASHSRAQGAKHIEHRKWPTVVSTAKALRAQETSGKKKASIEMKKKKTLEELSHLKKPEKIIPQFSLSSHFLSKNTLVVHIADGEIGYHSNPSLLSKIHLSMYAQDRLLLSGKNGAGKSTLVKALMNDSQVLKTGTWEMPKSHEIGYMDQHYQQLPLEKTVFEYLAEAVPTWINHEIRQHLNNFLFRKNEEVFMKIAHLSGGEKARLSLAFIAACPPKLLILDEITHHLDLETQEHVKEVLNAYPGAFILISHEENFFHSIKGIKEYQIGS